jgi:hypothetical protein
MNTIKIIVERHSNGYISYPLGSEGVVVGELERETLTRKL